MAALTSLHDERVGRVALDGDLGDEPVVDPPRDAPGWVSGDGGVTALAAGGADARGQRALVVDRLDGPGLQLRLLVARPQRIGALVVIALREVDSHVICADRAAGMSEDDFT